jgi:hypothetical protein
MKPSHHSAGASLLFLLAASTPSAAQNKITNGDFEQGNSAFFSNYFFGSDDLGAGFYDVRAFPENWNPFFSLVPGPHARERVGSVRRVLPRRRRHERQLGRVGAGVRRRAEHHVPLPLLVLLRVRLEHGQDADLDPP